MRYELKWEVGHSIDPATPPTRWASAAVPGAVQLDWARAEGWADYTYADNYKEYSWMEDVFWIYKTILGIPQLKENERLFFVSKGIDYKFDIRIDNRTVHSQEGMFTPFELELTDIAADAQALEVVIYPAPKREGAWVGRSQADQCCKPAVSYGWDWHPRLIPLGIWDDTYLEVRTSNFIEIAETTYDLSEDMQTADLFLDITLNRGSSEKLVWSLLDKNNASVFTAEISCETRKTRLKQTILSPELWWPNEQGPQTLYTSRVDLISAAGEVIDTRISRIGFRKVRLLMYPGAWFEPDGFPKSRSNPPITMEVNGRRIFCKGTNWVNPEIFPGVITSDTYQPLLELAKEAHFNLLRSWGGGIINKESFFDLCDEMGLMVWQEFPLACNNYAGTPDYLAVLDQESKSIIRRLRAHPSVTLWCGGNELFNGWSGMTDQSLALRLLNRNCYDLDPKTPFIATSPLEGMGHGHYSFKYDANTDVFQAMPKARNTAYTEFGCPGPSSVEYLKTFIPADELFPPKTGTAWEEHHAFKAWMPNSWLCQDTIESYFGSCDTIEKLVEGGQLLQSQGYKCIYEEARRQKPRCSMALNWCYNEPWPSAANNSLVNWPAIPKPAFYAVKDSCRPALASARIPKFQWREGEAFNPELWILNDSPDSIPGGCVDAYLKIENIELHLISWVFPDLEPNMNCAGPIVRYPLPHCETDRMILVLKVDGRDMDSEYTLAYQPNSDHKRHFRPRTMNL